MATRVPGYALAVKIGDKIIAGLITTGFKEKPNYEEVLHKEHAGVPDEDIEDSSRELSCSGQTYRRTPGEADAYEDYETIREAAAAGTDIVFSYYNPLTQAVYNSGVGRIIDFGEDANSKDTGTYSFTIKATAAWLASWNPEEFTGIPVLYSGSPLYVYLSRTILRVDGEFIHYGEESTTTPLLWWISYTKSKNGLNFTDKSAPVLSPGGVGAYDEKGQADPSVIYEGPGIWKMWFDALNGSDIWDKLGYATSPDGITWTKYGAVLSRGASGAWDDDFVHHPCVVKHNGVYYMFYAGSRPGMNYKIGLATSPDGITFTKYGTTPVIDTGSVGQFDSNYIRPSNPVLIQGTWYMWYWGYNGTVHALGLATSPDLFTWTKQGKVHDNNASASWVRLVEGDHPADKIGQIYYKKADGGVYLAKVTIPNTKTVIDGFEYDELKYGDTVKGTTNAAYTANYIYGSRITIPSAVSPNVIRAYVFSYLKPTSGFVKCAIYSNSGAYTPNVLLAVSEEKSWSTIMGDSWNEWIIATPPSLAPGEYWIAIWSTAAYRREKVTGGTANWFWTSLAYAENFPNPITAGSIAGNSGADLYVAITNTLNIYSRPLASEPTRVYFNNISGNKVSSKAAIDSQFDWYWEGGILYLFSGDEHPDIRYVITYE